MSTPSRSRASRTARAPFMVGFLSEHAEAEVIIRFSVGRVLVHPRHQPAQFAPDVLELVAGGFLAEAPERRFAGGVLGDPVLGELSAADLGQDLAHRLARLLGDDALAAGVVAVLGGVAD